MTFLIAARIAALVCMCGFATAVAQNAPNTPANASPAARVAPNVIESVEVRGLQRTSVDTLRAMLASKAGATYDDATVRGDVRKLWDSGRYDDIRVERLDGARGGVIIRFTLSEKKL